MSQSFRPMLERLEDRDTPAFFGPGQTMLAVGSDSGARATVNLYLPQLGEFRGSLTPFGTFAGGVRTAAGDLNLDSTPDLIVGAGPGGGPHVQVYSGSDLSLLRSFFAFAPAFRGGVFVAAGNLNDDVRADIIVGAGPGGAPIVKVFSGFDQTILRTFLAYNVNFTGGVRVAARDINGDRFTEIVTAPGASGGPVVKVFNGFNNTLLASWMAYAPNFAGGVYVAVGDVIPGGPLEVVTGPGTGGGPDIHIFRATNGQLLKSFFAFDASFRGGVRVGIADGNLDGQRDIIAGTGPGVASVVSIINAVTLQQVRQINPFIGTFTGGVFVGAS